MGNVKSLDLFIEPDQSTVDDDMKDEYDNLSVKEEVDLLMVEEGYRYYKMGGRGEGRLVGKDEVV